MKGIDDVLKLFDDLFSKGILKWVALGFGLITVYILFKIF